MLPPPPPVWSRASQGTTTFQEDHVAVSQDASSFVHTTTVVVVLLLGDRWMEFMPPAVNEIWRRNKSALCHLWTTTGGILLGGGSQNVETVS